MGGHQEQARKSVGEESTVQAAGAADWAAKGAEARHQVTFNAEYVDSSLRGGREASKRHINGAEQDQNWTPAGHRAGGGRGQLGPRTGQGGLCDRMGLDHGEEWTDASDSQHWAMNRELWAAKELGRLGTGQYPGAG